VGATITLAVAIGVARFAYTPLLPDMVNLFGWGFAQAGDVASANFMGYFIGAMLAPLLLRSSQRRAWFALSLMISVGTTYAGAHVSSLAGWIGLRFASGVASAFCLIMITTLLLWALSRYKATHLGNIHFAGVGIGIVLSMGAVMMGGGVDVQWARLGGWSAVLMLIGWMLLSRQIDLVGEQPPSTKSVRSPVRAVPLIWGYGFFGFAYVIAATFVVAMAQRLTTSAGEAQSVWVIVGLALIPSVYIWQYWAGRYGLLRVLAVAYVVEALGMLLLAATESYLGLAIACILLGGTFAAITALGLSAAQLATPDRVASVVSAMTIAFAFGQLLGPAVSGRMADYFGDFFLASLLATALLLVAAGLVGFSKRRASVTPADSD